MQKNASKHFPEFIGRVEIETPNTTTTHPTIDSAEGLLYLANQGTITFHIPASRTDDLWHPDRLVIDLDPDGDDPGQVADVTEASREILAESGIETGVMITGSSGFHLVADLQRTVDYDTLSTISRAIAGLIVDAVPELATTEFLKKDRGGKVFVDWLRNRPAQTVVAPWSLRPRPEATLAVPVTWDEVGSIHPAGVTIHDVSERLGVDVTWPAPIDLAPLADPIVAAARGAGVDLDTQFDRFRRRR